jgi:hypothetical protein
MNADAARPAPPDYHGDVNAIVLRRHHRNDGAECWKPQSSFLTSILSSRQAMELEFKAPSLEQLYLSFPARNFFADPTLKPESSVNYDYGFEQPLFKDTIRFGMTYFHNNITNLTDTNATFISYANIGHSLRKGVLS